MYLASDRTLLQEYVGKTLEVAGKGVDVTVNNLSQVVLPDGGAMTPPNMAVPTPARVQSQDVPTDPGVGGAAFANFAYLSLLSGYVKRQMHKKNCSHQIVTHCSVKTHSALFALMAMLECLLGGLQHLSCLQARWVPRNLLQVPYQQS